MNNTLTENMIKTILKPFSLLLIGTASLLTMSACHKEEPQFIPAPPDPPAPNYFECPNDNDIYGLLFDTMVFNSKAELYGIYDTEPLKMIKLNYQLDITMALVPCAQTLDQFGRPINSPSLVKVETDEGKLRDAFWKSGGLYVRDVILQEDIDRILTFPDGKAIEFNMALLNFKSDTIQTIPVTIMYKEKFPEN